MYILFYGWLVVGIKDAKWVLRGSSTPRVLVYDWLVTESKDTEWPSRRIGSLHVRLVHKSFLAKVKGYWMVVKGEKTVSMHASYTAVLVALGEGCNVIMLSMVSNEAI